MDTKPKLTESLQEALKRANEYTIKHSLKEVSTETLIFFCIKLHLFEAPLGDIGLDKVPDDVKSLYRILNNLTSDERTKLEVDLRSLLKRGKLISEEVEINTRIPFSYALTNIFEYAQSIKMTDDHLKPLVPKPQEVVIGIDDLFISLSLMETDDEEESELEPIRETLYDNGLTHNLFQKQNREAEIEGMGPDFKDALERIAKTAREIMNGERKESSDNEEDSEEEDTDFEAAGRKDAIETKKVDPNSKTPALDRYAVDMTKNAKEDLYDPVIGRDKEIEQIIEILCCRKKNNAVLTGDPGCGKTAIIESLAMRIVSGKVPIDLRDKRIFSLDLNSLVSGTQYRGQYEQRLQEVIKEVTTNKNIIIFIDELHNLIGNGSSNGSGDGANILKPYLARGEFQCIGSTTTDEYRKFIEKDGALKRRFSPVLIEEPGIEDTIQILKGIAPVYGKFHNTTYSDEVIEKCVKWSGKYINDRYFPDKAISVLDMASSLAKLENQVDANTSEVDRIENRLSEITKEKSAAIKDSKFEEAAKLRDEGRELEKELKKEKEKLTSGRPKSEVTIAHVSSVISKLSNIPIDNIQSSDIDKIRTMRDELSSKIIGQEEAVKEVTLALQRNIFGLRDPNKPIASFLFVGPTGVGKALRNGTPVLTVDGWKPIENLKIGELVATPYHRFSPVKGIFPQGKKDTLYRIHFKDGRTIDSDENHLWLVRTNKQQKYYRKTNGENTRHSCILTSKDLYDRLKDGYQNNDRTIKYGIPVSPIYNTEKNLPIDPYLLGVLLGDGCLTEKTKTTIIISSDEEDIIRSCAEILQCEYRMHGPKNYSNYLYGENVAKLTDTIKQLGLNCRSINKFIPEIYLEGSIDQRLSLLKGLIDTDGYINNGKYSVSTGSIQLRDDIINLCRSLGYIATYTEDVREGRNTNYTIRISTNDIIFSSKKRQLQYDRSIPRNRKYYNDHLAIVGIEKLDVKQENIETTCISIDDPDELFITKDYIVTHNTHIAKLVAKEFMGSENNLVTIACSEYMQDWAESKLLGSAPGYVGYTDSEPRLYVLKRKPYSVILIDEVEKSSSNLYNIWLNMLEEGEITLSSGEKVSCRNSIVIFTGNVGTKALELKGNGIGFATPEKDEKRKQDVATVMAEVKKEFRPEFINRISKIVVFNSLGKEEMDKIFYLELAKLQTRIKEGQGFDLQVSDGIKELIVSKCDPKYGARSLQRLITEYVEDNINLAMLDQDITGKTKIYLDIAKEDPEGVTVVFS